MGRFLSKSLVIFILLAFLPATAFLGREQSSGVLARAEVIPAGPGRDSQTIGHGLPGASELLQYSAGGHVLGFRTGDIVIASGSRALRVGFVNARPVSPVGEGSSESAKGRGPAQPLGKVTYRDLWDGVTLVYEKTESGVVESTYHIQPGETTAPDPVDQIQLRYSVPVSIDEIGSLVLGFATGEMVETRPIAWQEIRGRRVPIEVGYRLLGEWEVGFTVRSYDPRYPLVIDPVLRWNTFLGGYADMGMAIFVDTTGNIYVTGQSLASWGSPVRAYTPGGYDAFVAKLDANGALQWNTFLGGTAYDEGYRIAVDTSGSVYVTGESDATWGSPIRPFNGSYADAFAAKLNMNGVLQWNTFLGSPHDDYGYGIAVDANGDVYVTGQSFATWFSPITPFDGASDAFVAKLDGTGVLEWNTFLGQTGNIYGCAIALDAGGNIYVTGWSNCDWGSPINPFSGGTDAFVAKLDDAGALQWSTFLGGTAYDYGNGIAVDTSGSVYVTGESDATWGSPVGAFGGGADAFAAKLDNSGNLQWNTFLGGTTLDYGTGIAVDTNGNVYVTGGSDATWGSPARAFGGGVDGFAAKLSNLGNLQWSTFLGGTGLDESYGIAMGLSGNIYFVGQSDATWGTPIGGFVGYYNAFVAKISDTTAHADFNRDGQEDILWRCYGSGAYQGWNLVWLMHKSGTLAQTMMGTSRTETAGLDVLMGSRPANVYLTPLEAGNSQVILPAKSYESPMGAGRPLALKPRMVMRHPMEIGRNLAPRSKGRVMDEVHEGIPSLRSEIKVSSPMSGGTVKIASLDQSGQAVLSTIQDTTWEIAGSGDFNGDGNTDILWRCYGAGTYQGWNVIWYMDGTTVTSQGLPNVVYDTNWRIERTGDFDGDGKTDILWRYYGTGTYQGWNVIWYMNGATIKSQGFPNAVLDTNWKVDGVGDFDGDGTTDILWRYYGAGTYQGWNIIWYMNGTTIKSQGFPNVVSDTNWKVGGTGDFDGDGKSDILWRNYGTGTYQGWNILWYMNGATIKSQEVLKTISDTNWRIANR